MKMCICEYNKNKHIIKVIIENVPEQLTDEEIKEKVLGFVNISDYGLPWSNNYICKYEDAIKTSEIAEKVEKIKLL